MVEDLTTKSDGLPWVGLTPTLLMVSGRMGPKCGHICDDYNPCRHYAPCQRSLTMGSPQSYSCECGALQSGRYCEIRAQQPCPASWWGYPICGPCNCPTERGFKPSCNKTTGKCTCKVRNYIKMKIYFLK